MTHLRRAFETWFTAAYTGTDLYYGKTGYVNPFTQAAWLAWCAGRAYIAPARIVNEPVKVQA